MKGEYQEEVKCELKGQAPPITLTLIASEIGKIPRATVGEGWQKLLSVACENLDDAKRLLEKGQAAEALKKMDRCILLLEKCLELEKDNQDLALLQTAALHNAGSIAYWLANYATSAYYFRKAYDFALECYEKFSSTDFTHSLLITSKWLVKLPFDGELNYKALPEAKKILQLAENENRQNKTDVLERDMSCVLAQMGCLEFYENNFEDSIDYYKRALALRKGLVVTDQNFSFYCKVFDETYEFANIEDSKSNFKVAAEYFKLAIIAYTPAILQGYGVSFLPYLLSCHLYRANCFREMNNPIGEKRALIDGINLIKLLPEELKQGAQVIRYIAYIYTFAGTCAFFLGEKVKGFKYITESYNYAKKLLLFDNINGLNYKCYVTVKNVYETYKQLMEHT